ncbi:hypothetical protein R69619_05345 [Paraburkholderia nemoris]|nr:hypothetical protein R69619_05345 [Paraburkholderia nemoris]
MKNDRHDWLRAAAKMPLLIAGLAFASAAFAHVFPQKQEPGAGATVASPAQVRVIFDGPLEPSFSSLTVTDASGKQSTRRNPLSTRTRRRRSPCRYRRSRRVTTPCTGWRWPPTGIARMATTHST